MAVWNRQLARLAAVAAAGLLLVACGSPVTGSTGVPEVASAAQRAASSNTDCGDGLPADASFAPDRSLATPAGSTMAAIRKQGYLRLATNGDVQLWGATDLTTGDPVGYDVDLATAIAKQLGVSVRYTVIPFSQRQKALQSGQVDLVAQQMTITCDRWKGTSAALPGINFSIPYYTSGAQLLVRRDFSGSQATDLKQEGLVCGAAGSSSLASLDQVGLDTTTRATTGECVVAFMEGEVVAVVGDATTLAGFQKQDRAAKIIGTPINPGQYGLGLPPAADKIDFTRYVNAVLEKFRADGTLDRLYDTWMKPTVGASPPAVPAPQYGRTISKINRLSS